MPVTVLQISDTHFAKEPGPRPMAVDSDLRLQQVLSKWQERGEQADLVLFTGDASDDYSIESYERPLAMMQAVGAPVMGTPGNHDTDEDFFKVFGEQSVAELGGWRIICVNTSLPDDVPGLIHAQNELGFIDAMDEIPTLLALHHPVASNSSHEWFQLAGGAELLEGLATRPQVKAITSGHTHEPFEQKLDSGLLLLGCPAVSSYITHTGSEFEIQNDEPAGAQVLYLEDDGSIRHEVFFV